MPFAGALTAGTVSSAGAAPLPTHIDAIKSASAGNTIQVQWRGGWRGGGWRGGGWGEAGGWGGAGAGLVAGALIGGAIASSTYGGPYGYYGAPYATVAAAHTMVDTGIPLMVTAMAMRGLIIRATYPTATGLTARTHTTAVLTGPTPTGTVIAAGVGNSTTMQAT